MVKITEKELRERRLAAAMQCSENVRRLKESGDLDRVSHLLSMAYLVFTTANGYAEQAYQIAEKYGLGVKRMKVRSNNLMQSFDAYNNEMVRIVGDGPEAKEAMKELCVDSEVFDELLDAFFSRNLTIKRGTYFGATLYLPQKK